MINKSTVNFEIISFRSHSEVKNMVNIKLEISNIEIKESKIYISFIIILSLYKHNDSCKLLMIYIIRIHTCII
jgi:hypothetical protein